MTANLAQDLRALGAGEILDSQAAREDRSGDFGRMIRRVPPVVARPRSTADVAAIIRYARKASIPVATRGEAHSQSGQSLTDSGILLDLTSLDQVLSLDETGLAADCQAGVRWETLVRQTLSRGLVPPVLTNNLGVTVGGTLSVAGLGVASFRHGTQGDNVTEIEAVLGTGDIVVCSPDHNRETFDAVRSSLGQFGVITRARLRLRRCLAKARTYFLLYDDLAALMRAAEIVMTDNRVDYLESWCVPCPQVQFAGRLEPLFAVWKRSGYWGMMHPWMETVLPWAAAGTYIPQILANLPPTALGGGHVLLWPCRGDVSRVPLFMRPPEAPLVMGFGILPGVPPDLLPLARPRLNMASDLSVMAGGKRYLSGFIEFDRPRWQQHFGARWNDMLRLKKTCDPDGILNPGFIDYGS